MFRIGPQERAEVEAWLLEDAVAHLRLLAALQSGEGGLYGVRAPEGITGVGLVRGPSEWAELAAADEESAARLGAGLRGHCSGVLAERWKAEAFWEAAGGAAPRSSQRWLCTLNANEMGPFTCPQLRPARAEELPALQQLLREALVEEASSLLGPGAALETAIANKRVYLLEESGTLALAVLLEVLSPQGALIASVITASQQRRRGLATLATGQICRSLLASLPEVAAYVNADDEKAVGLSRKLGFSRRRRLLLLQEG